ncbi:MAG TPA: glycosyltransferase family 2 protein [Planctomycetota bacterium]|nr:glycosyltransferase family 2 protein [Planctomycetota bacterium]
MKVAVIIPAFNEEEALPRVLSDLPRAGVETVIVVDNASTDRTAEVATAHGARVVREERRGYGSACLRGIASLPKDIDVVAFLDADHSDHPEELPRVLEPILTRQADLVIGSRVRGERERGALLPQARFGNWLATRLIRLFWGQRYTDLGPFRAIRREALERIDMQDRDFGWTVEMQVRAIQEGLRIEEVPVSYRRRIGKSKITGTIRGTIRAGIKILWTIGRLRWGRRKTQRGRIGNKGGTV